MKKINFDIQPDFNDVEYENTGLNMPKELKEQLRRLARQNKRSLSKQILLYLEQSLKNEFNST